MNKVRISLVWILLLCIGVVGGLMTMNYKALEHTQIPVKMITKDSKIPLKIESYTMKLNTIDTLNELERNSPIIIEGMKMTEVVRQIREDKNPSQLRGSYTESNFQIQKVYKNEKNNAQIQKNHLIQVCEAEVQFNGQMYTINGYKKMTKGKRYLLYLVQQEGRFIPKEWVYGKIPLYTTDIGLYSDEELEVQDVGNAQSMNELTNELAPIFKEARQKYK